MVALKREMTHISPSMSASAAGISIPGAGPSIPLACQDKQLAYLAGRLTATEINAPSTSCNRPPFPRWGEAAPAGFKFAVKASRFCTNRKNLGEAGEAVGKFCAQG